MRSPPQGLSHHCWAPTAGGNAHRGLTPLEMTPGQSARWEGDEGNRPSSPTESAPGTPRRAKMQIPPHSYLHRVWSVIRCFLTLIQWTQSINSLSGSYAELGEGLSYPEDFV